MTKRQITEYHELSLDACTLQEAINTLTAMIEEGVPSDAHISLGADEGFYCEVVSSREETEEEYEKRVEQEKKWAALREKQKAELEYKTYIVLKEKFENININSFL